MNNLLDVDIVKKYISINKISFLIDFDKTINIDKKGKSYYHKMFNIQLNEIVFGCQCTGFGFKQRISCIFL